VKFNGHGYWYHCSTFELRKEVWWRVDPEGHATRVRNKQEALRRLRHNNRARRAAELRTTLPVRP
jgi:hypothetical protein